jgi:hypothetical protein
MLPSTITLITSDPVQVDRLTEAYETLAEIEIVGKIYRVIEGAQVGRTTGWRFELMELIKL